MMVRRCMLAIGALFGLSTEPQCHAAISILFIGNSYTSANDLPHWVRHIGSSMGTTTTNPFLGFLEPLPLTSFRRHHHCNCHCCGRPLIPPALCGPRSDGRAGRVTA